MLKIKSIIISGLLIIVFYSCGVQRRNVKHDDMSGGYDTSAFDYIFVEGVKQKVLGNYGEAIQCFEKAIQINNNSDASYFQISQVLTQVGDSRNSKKYAIKASELDRGNEVYLNYIAGIYYSEKVLDSAVLFYEKALKLKPDEDNLKFNLANLYSEIGDFSKSGQLIRFLEDKYGKSESLTLLMIHNLIRSKNFNEAESRVKLLLSDNPDSILFNGLLAEIYRAKGEDLKAIEIYQKLVEIDPENAQTLVSLTDFFFAKGEFKDYFDLLNKVLVKDNVTREDKIGLLSKAIENDSVAIAYQKSLDISLMLLEANYKQDQLVPLLRADVYIKSGRKNEAESLLLKLIQENKDNYYACEKLLLLYADTGENEKLFSRGNEYSMHFNRAVILKMLYATGAMGLGKYDIAEKELKKAEILASGQEEIIAQIQATRADMFYKKGEFEKSFQAFEEALNLSPEDIILQNNYAYFLAEKDTDLKKALKMAENVVKQDRKPTYLDTYAWVLYKLGRNSDAIKVMEDIRQTGLKDAEWLEHYGFMLERAGKCKNAIDYWQQAIELDKRKIYLETEISKCKN
ncbi:MAG: tetratricopeptide repeat protein [Bacteroidales bacterium]